MRLQYVLKVAESIGKYMKHHMSVVNKSTVPVGTADRVEAKIQEELDRRGSNLTFDVISNPEFLKEGDAINDFMKPDRVVVGAKVKRVLNTMRELLCPHLLEVGVDFSRMGIRVFQKMPQVGLQNADVGARFSFWTEMGQFLKGWGHVNMVGGNGGNKGGGVPLKITGRGNRGPVFPQGSLFKGAVCLLPTLLTRGV